MGHAIFKGLRKNKRGEDMLVDFWAILVFAVIVLLFFVIFSVNRSKIKNEMNAEFDAKDIDYMLESFLSAPLEDDPSRTVSDVILEDCSNDDYKHTKELFEEYFKYTAGINGQAVNDLVLHIEGENKGTVRMTADGGTGSFGKAMILASSYSTGITTDSHTASTYLPGYVSKTYVELTIVGWEG